MWLLYVLLLYLAMFVFLSICCTQVSILFSKDILISMMLPDEIQVVYISEEKACQEMVFIPKIEFHRLGNRPPCCWYHQTSLHLKVFSYFKILENCCSYFCSNILDILTNLFVLIVIVRSMSKLFKCSSRSHHWSLFLASV